ncbi:rhomboid family intramembrane serine protease [Halomonas pacifica]|uniref:Rhomboid family intramembrane serine protease n=1 Tax=Bisbaumannia pacifica TaxID=77098 RepID=A0A510XBB7_9GAMM|nr:rhomboid family intramembrane serine protease [Halomonas pacifica]MBH8579909.1 rhomboid family intramembrane serine protease [Halomonas pacifica]MDC8803511.1 rhomboid family intramembrane serine protease [Halomonas pacifica]GEK47987.1 rhomboid family intramembrane serine protease [Halomonas pacifica]
MYKVLTLPRDVDTRPLRQALWAHRIGHRFTEDEEGYTLWLADPDQYQQLLQLVERWRRGEPLMPQGRAPRAATQAPAWSMPFRLAPVTASLLAACVAVFGLMALFGDLVIAWLAIVPLAVARGSLVVGDMSDVLLGQPWRLFTPALLHFGWMHLIFNMLWLWYFGRQIEALRGRGRMLLIVLLSGVGGNLAQYATGTVLFGGMSGVDFALLGYVWLMSRRAPGSGFFVPQMLVVFMLGWMVFTMTDMAAAVGFGNVANEAHLGGLVVGLILGWYDSARARQS